MNASTLLSTLCLLAMTATTSAAERRIRLTVEAQAEGTEGMNNGGDHTSGKFRENYRMVTYLKSDGELMQFNPKDPDYAQKMTGMAAAQMQRARGLQGKPPAKKMSPEELQAYLTKKQKACGSDSACLLRLATEAQQLASAAYQSPSTGSSVAAYTGDEPPRFLVFYGYENCGARGHSFIDRRIEGTLADVGGNVPYTMTEQVDYENQGLDINQLCLAHQMVLDTQDGKFYSDGFMMPRVRGTSTITLRGETKKSVTTSAGNGEVFASFTPQVRHIARNGDRSWTGALTQPAGIALHSGKYSGQAKARVTWKIEDVK
jgi:hypothetical protein